jgi:hypothetical protein
MEDVLPEDIKDIITWYNNRIPVKSILSNLHAKCGGPEPDEVGIDEHRLDEIRITVRHGAYGQSCDP